MKKPDVKTQLNMLISVFDTELRKLAEWAAGRVPAGSIADSENFERAFGVLKSYVEGLADNMNPFVGAFVEKLTDVGDIFIEALKRGPGTSISADAAKRIATAISAADELLKRFYVDAMKRIADAPNEAAKRAEFDKIKTEFELLREFFKLVDGALKQDAGGIQPPAPKTAESVDYKKLRADVRRFTKKTKGLVKSADHAAATQINRLSDWLEGKK